MSQGRLRVMKWMSKTNKLQCKGDKMDGIQTIFSLVTDTKRGSVSSLGCHGNDENGFWVAQIWLQMSFFDKKNCIYVSLTISHIQQICSRWLWKYQCKIIRNLYKWKAFPSYRRFRKPLQQMAFWKHSDKRRNCTKRAISPFATMFSTFRHRLSIQL